MKQKNTTPTSKKQDKATAEVLKIGIDAHKAKYVPVCQHDNQSPKAPQKFEPEAFLVWIAKQAERLGEVHSFRRSASGSFRFLGRRVSVLVMPLRVQLL